MHGTVCVGVYTRDCGVGVTQRVFARGVFVRMSGSMIHERKYLVALETRQGLVYTVL